MTQQEYEKEQTKAWEMYLRLGGAESSICASAVHFVFDRAYALGKQFGISEQLEADKAK